jgi:hypothetical protein
MSAMKPEENPYKTYETLSTLFALAFVVALFLKFLFF